MVLLGFLVLCACWSTTWYAIRLCLRGYPPLSGAALRFLLAAALMAVGVAVYERLRPACRERGKPAPTPHGPLALAGLANGAGYALLYLAEQTISGGTAAVIAASNPFFTALAARLAGLERFLPQRLLGILVGFLGVVVMLAEGFDRSPEHLGAMVLVAIAAALLWPVYGVILKRHAAACPPLRLSAVFLGYTGLALLLMAVGRGEDLRRPLQAPLSAHLGLLYLAVVGSVTAWTIYLWLLRRLDLTVLSTMGLIQPVMALVVDLVVGDFALRWRGFVGAALVLSGVIGAVLWPTRRAPLASGSEPLNVVRDADAEPSAQRRRLRPLAEAPRPPASDDAHLGGALEV